MHRPTRNCLTESSRTPGTCPGLRRCQCPRVYGNVIIRTLLWAHSQIPTAFRSRPWPSQAAANKSAAHRIHVLNPDRVHGAVEDEPLLVRRGIAGTGTEGHRKNSVCPLMRNGVKLTIQLAHGDGLRVDDVALHTARSRLPSLCHASQSICTPEEPASLLLLHATNASAICRDVHARDVCDMERWPAEPASARHQVCYSVDRCHSCLAVTR